MYHQMDAGWTSPFGWLSMTLMMFDGIVLLGLVVYLAVRFTRHDDPPLGSGGI